MVVLAGAGIEVQVSAGNALAGSVDDVVVTHVVVPARHVDRHEAHAVEMLCQIEHPGHRGFAREVAAQGFLIDGKTFAANAFSVEVSIPAIELGLGQRHPQVLGLGPAQGLELEVLDGRDLAPHLRQEAQHVLRCARHLPLQCIGGVGWLAEQAGQFLAQVIGFVHQGEVLFAADIVEGNEVAPPCVS